MGLKKKQEQELIQSKSIVLFIFNLLKSTHKIMIKSSLVCFLILIIIISCSTVKTNNQVLRISETVKKELNYIDYYPKIYEADSLFLTNNFEKSYKILDSLFQIYPPLNTENYSEYNTYLSSAVMSGHLQDIDKKVKFGYIHFGNISAVHKQYFADTINSIAHLNDDKIESLKEIYRNSLNLSLRNKILEIFKEDQRVREEDDLEAMETVDKKNRVELENIMKEYGYPSNNLIGGPSAYDLEGGYIHKTVLFMHQPEDFKMKYLPLILEGVKIGKCDPTTYAMVYDKMIMQKEHRQLYGSFNCNSEDLCDLVYPDKLDSIRKSIGLPNGKYYNWKIKQLTAE